MNKRKFFGTIIGIIFWSICIVFFTYAYYEWKSINTSIVLGIQDLATQCSKGPDVNVSNIGPVFNPSDGVKVKFNLTNDLTTTQNFAIELNITSISDTLLVDDFKWVLVKDEDYDTPIEEGDFSNFVVGTNTIADILPLESNTSNLYQFIVYIDGNMYNDPNIQNNSLKSYLGIGNCGIIAEVNQMVNSSTDTFRSDTYKTNIVTASFVDYTPFSQTEGVSSQNNISSSDLSLNENSLVPSMLTDTTDLIYWDMSKYQDGRVVAWLEDSGTVDDNGNTNYNLYIGSDTLTYLTNMSNFFNGMTNLTSISFDNIDTSLVTNMSGMFRGCSNLTSIDLSNINTSNVTKMDAMFSDCSSLTSLDVSNFDTSNVTSMGNDSGNSGMFYRCSSLTSLDVSNFDTSKVTGRALKYMFYNCKNLIYLDVSNWDVSNVTSIQCMFYNCNNLAYLDVSNWDVSKVMDMTQTFIGCNSLTSLDVSNWDVSNVTGMQQTFSGCKSLTELDVSNWDTSSATVIVGMFNGCNSLTQLDVSKWNTSKVKSIDNVFKGCSSLTSLDVSNWDTSIVTSMSNTFSFCNKLQKIIGLTSDTLNLNFVTNKVTNMYYMFQNCNSLTELDLSNFDTSNVTDMYAMFMYCYELVNLNLGDNFDTSNVTTTHWMFFGSTKIVTTITIRNVDVTDYGAMFGNKAATAEGASITVNYTTETSSLVDNMIATGTGNLIKPDNPVPVLTA